MVLAIASLLVATPLRLAGEESVGISYPNFFADLATLLPKEVGQP